MTFQCYHKMIKMTILCYLWLCIYTNCVLLHDLPFFRPAEKKVVKIAPPTSASEVSVVIGEGGDDASTDLSFQVQLWLLK